MRRSILSMLAGGSLLVASAAPVSIGVIRSAGDFRVDGSTVRGNGTIFDGNRVETTAARSVVQLEAGQVTLAPDSRAQVFHDRTVLEKGAGLLRSASHHVFEAGTLQVVPDGAGAVIQVDIDGPGRIAVSAHVGGAQVRNSKGVMLASVRTGMALAFDAQAAASGAVRIQGAVEVKDGNYFLTDTTSGVKFQLQGADLAKYVGKQVQVKGSLIPDAAGAAGASQVVAVGTITATTVAGVAAVPTTGGIFHATLIAVIGGVSVAGTVGGLAAAGAFSSGGDTSVK